MLKTPQSVKMKWSRTNKAHYINLGYKFTKLGDIFEVQVEDLMKSSNVRVDIICDYCGKLYNAPYNKYNRKTGKDACVECKKYKTQQTIIQKYGWYPGRKKLDKDVVYNEFKERGLIVLSEYVNADSPMKFICPLHEDMGIQLISYSRVKQGQGCRYCGIERRNAQKRKYTIDDVRNIFEQRGCILLSKEYKNVDEKLDYICVCGNKSSISLYEFMRGSNCRACGYKKYSGENHYNWKGGITPEEEKFRKSKKYIKWRDAVFKRDDYTCQACGSRGVELNAHHLDGFHWCKEKRLDINNGITLCEECHYSFHKVYGIKYNTREQFIEWIEKYRNSTQNAS